MHLSAHSDNKSVLQEEAKDGQDTPTKHTESSQNMDLSSQPVREDLPRRSSRVRKLVKRYGNVVYFLKKIVYSFSLHVIFRVEECSNLFALNLQITLRLKISNSYAIRALHESCFAYISDLVLLSFVSAVMFVVCSVLSLADTSCDTVSYCYSV